MGPSWGVRFPPLATTCFCCTTTSLIGRSVGDSFAVTDAWQRVREDSGKSPSPGRRESLVPDGNRTPSFGVICFRPLVRSNCKVRTLGAVFGQPIPCQDKRKGQAWGQLTDVNKVTDNKQKLRLAVRMLSGGKVFQISGLFLPVVKGENYTNLMGGAVRKGKFFSAENIFLPTKVIIDGL